MHTIVQSYSRLFLDVVFVPLIGVWLCNPRWCYSFRVEAEYGYRAPEVCTYCRLCHPPHQNTTPRRLEPIHGAEAHTHSPKKVRKQFRWLVPSDLLEAQLVGRERGALNDHDVIFHAGGFFPRLSVFCRGTHAHRCHLTRTVLCPRGVLQTNLMVRARGTTHALSWSMRISLGSISWLQTPVCCVLVWRVTKVPIS